MKGIPMIHDVRERGECEIVNPRTLEPACKRPATLRYPAMGGGYMRFRKWVSGPDPEHGPHVPLTTKIYTPEERE